MPPRRKAVSWAKGFRPPGLADKRTALGLRGSAVAPEYDLTLAEELFSAVPHPTDKEDWLAQWAEEGQTYGQWRSLMRLVGNRYPDKKPIYVCPIGSFEGGPSVDQLVEFVAAYYHGLTVEPYVALPLVQDGGKYFAGGEGRRNRQSVQSRVAHPYDLENPKFVARDHLQLRVGDLLKALQGHKPARAHCVIGITMHDLYSGTTDSFSVGYAAGGDGTGVFSFCRYRAGFSLFKQPARRIPQQDPKEMLLRCCKTLVHEIAHTYQIDHCVYYNCLMRGTGHLEEDFATPVALCPIDLRKLLQVCDTTAIARYDALAEFYKKYDLEEERAWVVKRLEQVTPRATGEDKKRNRPAATDDGTDDAPSPKKRRQR